MNEAIVCPSLVPMVEMRDLVAPLGRDGQRGICFRLAEFLVMPGETVALTGPSGCGKSTLLNLVAGLRRPSQGIVRVAGNELGSMTTARLDRYRGRFCGIIFQNFHLLAPFTALENVRIGLRFGARPTEGVRNERARAEMALDRVGLAHRRHARPAELSMGERQRVAIARALAGGAPLLLADEPTGSLDPATGREVFALLREAARAEGRTLLFVTHDPALAAELPRHFDCTGLVAASAGEGGTP
jgi:ABC-type lipoprotein export system ATPase subunit